MENVNLENAILYASDRHGVYIPQYFAESIKREFISGIDLTDLHILEVGPDLCNESYWNVWNDVEMNAIVTDPDSGIEYCLYQDGDLWLVPVNDMQGGSV